ncbi:MAG: carbohydrate ABC transporter permease [Lachnospiraceae bacterium]
MRKKRQLYPVIRYVVLTAATLIAICPFLVLPIVSFKTKSEFLKYPLTLPSSINFQNYITVLERSNILMAFANSMIITGGSVVLEVLVGTLAAYAITKMDFKHAGKFSIAFLIPMIFPIQTITIPVYIIFRNLGLVNTHLGMIIIYGAVGLPIVVFMMTSFMKTIPYEISESAVVDGASNFTIYRKLILPLLKPVISTVAVICGLSVWNDFYIPMIMLTSTGKKTLPLKVYDFLGQYTSDWTLVCTCIIYVIVPIMIFYCILQKNIISGIAAGAVKG